MIESSKFEFKNRSSKELEGILQINLKPKGLVFIAHGLGGHMRQKHIQAIAEAFAENGYNTVRWNAYFTVAKKRNSLRLRNATATAYLHDLEDVIKWAKKQVWYQEPFILAGHSMGSFVSLLYATRNPEKVKAIAPTSAAVSGKFYVAAKTPEEMEDWKKRGYREWLSDSGKGIIKRLNIKFVADFMRYDVLKNADKLTMPILLIVGDKDEVTPLYQQRILLEKLGSHNKMLKIIEGSPHTFREPAQVKALKNSISTWCGRL